MQGSPSLIMTRPIIFFDYDDTILNSTQIAELGLRLAGDHSDAHHFLDHTVQAMLAKLEQSAASMLAQAQTLGDVVIVTNGEAGWVELSAQKFLPGLLPIIGSLRVISARSAYQSHNPACPITWKALAFNAIADMFPEVNQIISIGDSLVERNAARLVARGRQMFCKTVKFCERPSLDQLLAQQQVVFMSLSEVVQTQDHLDLALTISAKQQSTSITTPSSMSSSGSGPMSTAMFPAFHNSEPLALNASAFSPTAGPDLVPPVGAGN